MRHRARLVFWFVLLASWLALIPLLWDAFSTVPPLERLDRSRMVPIPTLRAVAVLALQSAVEAAVVLAMLFPWRPRRYLARLWVATLGVWVWFLATTPLGLTRMAWLHRRWLAAWGAVLLVAAGVATLVRLARPLTPDRDRPGSPGGS